MKTLHKFTISKKETKKVEEETKDGTLIKDKEEVVPFTIALKKPSRRELEEAEMLYSVELSKCITRGVLTKKMLANQYSDKGGSWSEDERGDYLTLYNDFISLQQDYTKATISEDAKDERVKAVQKNLWDVYQQLQEYESRQAELFDNTAEVISRNKVMTWLMINLTYLEDGPDNFVPFFRGDTYEDKLDYYDELLDKEDNEFERKVSEKASVFVSFWYTGRIGTEEEFKFLEETIEETEEEGEEPKEEESDAKPEEPKAESPKKRGRPPKAKVEVDEGVGETV